VTTLTQPCYRCGAATNPGARFCEHCGANVKDRPPGDAPVPERLQAALGSDYRVMGELGRGGFAVVYSVKDLRLNRYLAVKVIRPALVASERMVERFRREAQMVSQLSHPNILTVSFAGEADGVVFYAMPRVQGRTLREILRERGKLSMVECLKLFHEMTSALDHAHAQGIVHRDVKPANVMLEHSGGRALLLDFGIAKALAATGGNLSISGQIIGSLEYMSPEQAAGSKTIDARSDIYSLGIVLFEAVTGRLPFAGATVDDFVSQHTTGGAPDVRTHRPDTPDGLANVIARCMAREPAERWQTAGEAAAELK